MNKGSKLFLLLLLVGLSFFFPTLLWIYIFFGLYYLFSRIKIDNATEAQSILNFHEDIENIDINNIPKVNFKLQWENIKYNSHSILSFLSDLIKFKTIRKRYYQTLKTHTELRNILESHSVYNTIQLKSINEVLERKIHQLNQVIYEKQNILNIKENAIKKLDEQSSLNLTGFISPLYNLGDSEQYKIKLEEIQNQQKIQIQNDSAISLGTNWVLGNNQKAGQKMMKDISKLILRSFNNECNSIIAKMKHSNGDSIVNRLQVSFESINKLASMLHISIKPEFLQLKIKEGFVKHEYEIQKQKEKEADIEQRERLKEQAKVEQEIERQKAINDKEKQHFINKRNELEKKLNTPLSITDRDKILQNLNDIKNHIAICEQKNADLNYRRNKASAGYVYIISNIGSFGENVYKIGVTRRLDPQDRIDELASASVPFRFDVHSIIFSDEAFKLENALHKAFEKNRVNLMNNRKEFFKLDLKDLNRVLKNNFNNHFELKYEADAIDFRESERIRQLK